MEGLTAQLLYILITDLWVLIRTNVRGSLRPGRENVLTQVIVLLLLSPFIHLPSSLFPTFALPSSLPPFICLALFVTRLLSSLSLSLPFGPLLPKNMLRYSLTQSLFLSLPHCHLSASLSFSLYLNSLSPPSFYHSLSLPPSLPPAPHDSPPALTTNVRCMSRVHCL